MILSLVEISVVYKFTYKHYVTEGFSDAGPFHLLAQREMVNISWRWIPFSLCPQSDFVSRQEQIIMQKQEYPCGSNKLDRDMLLIMFLLEYHVKEQMRQ